MTEPRKLRVFLCHASQDKPLVRELYQRLLAEGWIDPWLDEEKLLPGQDWDMEIEKAVEAADAVIVCLSNRSVSKEGYIQKEIKKILDKAEEKPDGTIYVIPLLLNRCTIPQRLLKWQWQDWNSQNGYEKLLQSLQIRADNLNLHWVMKIAKRDSYEFYEKKRRYVLSEIALKMGGNHKVWGDIEFIKIPKGKFIMGIDATNDDIISRNASPQHSVDIPYDYWIGRFPITNRQFNEFLINVRNRLQISSRILFEFADHPVREVKWEEALAYSKWLNKKFGTRLPDDLQFRLPTEAEWEKAARGKKGNIWPWGSKFKKNHSSSIDSYYPSPYYGLRHPVGAFSPQGDSPFGVADMSSNVWQWTQSIYKPYPYDWKDGRENLKVSASRVARGGSFGGPGKLARATNRLEVSDPFFAYDVLGLRMVIAPNLDYLPQLKLPGLR